MCLSTAWIYILVYRPAKSHLGYLSKKMKEYNGKKKKCDISHSSKCKFLKIFTSTNFLLLNYSTKDGLRKKIIILINIFVEIQNIIYSEKCH